MTMNKFGATRLGIVIGYAAVATGASALAGCVQIATPEKPIEINLNINIRQEIVYKLDGDAKKLIEQNSEIF